MTSSPQRLKVYDDDKVSQDDVDAAEAALSAAIDALKTKPTTPVVKVRSLVKVKSPVTATSPATARSPAT